mgnify:FL=1
MENFSIGILTWKSPLTLKNTLESYRKNGLLQLTDDITVFAQDVSVEDIEVAEEYGIPSIIGIRENIGIGKAFNRLFEDAKYDKVMILENDWVLIEDKATTERVIKETIAALDGIVHFARLRHVKNPGLTGSPGR